MELSSKFNIQSQNNSIHLTNLLLIDAEQKYTHTYNQTQTNIHSHIQTQTHTFE